MICVETKDGFRAAMHWFRNGMFGKIMLPGRQAKNEFSFGLSHDKFINPNSRWVS